MCSVEEGVNRCRRPSTFIRVTRAVSCSLALHAMAWAALREGPPTKPYAISPTVSLMVSFPEAEWLHEIERVALVDAEWTPDAMMLIPPEPTPEIEPPIAAQELFEEPLAPAEEPVEEPASPYWQNVRREMARALKWPTGWQTPTNVGVRVLALADRVLPLEPKPDAGDAIQSAVRKAVERAASRVEPPPDDVVGRDMRLMVRFEPAL